jgi:hypothetical protein
MFRLDDELKAYVHRDAVDFREGINGLAAIVPTLNLTASPTTAIRRVAVAHWLNGECSQRPTSGPRGLSVFSCSRRLAVQTSTPRIRALIAWPCNAILVEDRELPHGGLPVVSGAMPIRGDVAQRQPQTLGGRIV